MTPFIFPAFLFLLAFVPMAFEAQVASRHDRALRQRGAREPADDVYPIMQVAYPASFIAMILEAWWRGAGPSDAFPAGLLVFALAKGVKYWAIASLGPRWSFRVMVPPDAPLVATGPYRFIRHPNYVGVIGELGGMGLMCRAAIAGPIAVAVFALIIVVRIRIEERALGLRTRN